MGHVEDRWHATRAGVKARTGRYGTGRRWKVRYTVDGRPRSRSYDRKVDAEAFLVTVSADQLRGTFVDPREGRVTFREYAEAWRAAAAHRPSTRDRVERTLRLHVYPLLGDRRIGAVRTSAVQAFVTAAAQVLAPATVRVAYSVVVAVFRAAVRDRVIPASPCEGVRLPDARRRRPEPPDVAVVDRLAAELPARFRAVVELAAGSGLRQGEAFGLEVEHVDFLRGRHVRVAQQLVTLAGQPPFLAPPKTPESERVVPLAQLTLDALAAHLAAFPAVTAVVDDRTDPRRPVRREARLLFARPGGSPVGRHDWSLVFGAAAGRAGLPKGTGLHLIRHLYASMLIRHGESVKTVQARLGHSSAAITLDVYGHLWPDADDTTRAAVEAALSGGSRPRPEAGSR